MDAQDSTEKFKESKTLYQQGRFREALEVLTALDRKYPRTKNILYPMALCLDKIDCQGEALDLCDRLIQEFGDPRAVELKRRIQTPQAPTVAGQPPAPPGAAAGGPDLASDFLGERKPRPVPQPPAASSKRTVLIIVGVVAALLLLVVAPLVIGAMSGGLSQPPTPPPDAAAPEVTMPGLPSLNILILIGLVFLVLTFVVSCACLYFVMNFMGHLQYDDLNGNLLDVAKCQLIMTLLSLIPIIGWIFALIYLSKHFDLSCGELVIAFIALVVLNGVVWFILSAIFGTAIGGALSMYSLQPAL